MLTFEDDDWSGKNLRFNNTTAIPAAMTTSTNTRACIDTYR